MYSANAPARLTPTPCVRAQVAASGQTVPAPPTNNVPLAADNVARMKVPDIRSHRDDLSDELMPDDQWNRNSSRAGPFVPFVDVEIGAANAGIKDANLYVANIRPRLLHVFQPQTVRLHSFLQGLSSLGLPSPADQRPTPLRRLFSTEGAVVARSPPASTQGTRLRFESVAPLLPGNINMDIGFAAI